MRKKQIEKWINALRSGEYGQGRNSLQEGDNFCCLGVACKVFIPKEKLDVEDVTWDTVLTGTLPGDQKHAPEWLKGIDDDFQRRTSVGLSGLNDDGYKDLDPFTFDEIADLLQLVYIEGALD